MVSLRCRMIVKDTLEKLGLPFKSVKLGEVEFEEDITEEKRKQLSDELLKSGLEVMEDKKAILIERIKNVIVEMVHYADDFPKTKSSEYLASKLRYDYTYMSKLFSQTQGITIEHFTLLHKIERVKELIMYDELNLTEISHMLHYSSVAHLSTQFKKVTGLTPTFFKTLKQRNRKDIEEIG